MLPTGPEPVGLVSVPRSRAARKSAFPGTWSHLGEVGGVVGPASHTPMWWPHLEVWTRILYPAKRRLCAACFAQKIRLVSREGYCVS